MVRVQIVLQFQIATFDDEVILLRRKCDSMDS